MTVDFVLVVAAKTRSGYVAQTVVGTDACWWIKKKKNIVGGIFKLSNLPFNWSFISFNQSAKNIILILNIVMIKSKEDRNTNQNVKKLVKVDTSWKNGSTFY